VLTPTGSAQFVLLIYIVIIEFEFLTAVSTKMAVFWVVAPCTLVEVYHRPDDGGSKDL
jgi:hypothetical protein